MKNYSLAISLAAAFLAVIALIISPVLSLVVVFVSLALWLVIDSLANVEDKDVARCEDEEGTVLGRLDSRAVTAD